ncbi:MAG: DUF4326 domain-containing protein [Ktedonobacterales bacterium]|nr:DUF4326 domain-containing protein [Ktedonobacterales bacterium]
MEMGIPDQRTRVVNVRHEDCDQYIGRRMPGWPDGTWGNPYKVGRDGSRAEVIGKYREWVRHQPHLVARLPELRGKTLGCWCAPRGGLPGNLHGTICHGEVLAALADMREE